MKQSVSRPTMLPDCRAIQWTDGCRLADGRAGDGAALVPLYRRTAADTNTTDGGASATAPTSPQPTTTGGPTATATPAGTTTAPGVPSTAAGTTTETTASSNHGRGNYRNACFIHRGRYSHADRHNFATTDFPCAYYHTGNNINSINIANDHNSTTNDHNSTTNDHNNTRADNNYSNAHHNGGSQRSHCRRPFLLARHVA
ncbi:hypothetical protein FJT64_007378 [Amphibalanus amphitrite]|uniref:Uncharacterized protein n=1 Tax=Amphibalanus amphitrite TaxID=1232801 RepID=A0A6A4VW49_AMPAM|nr:hypothetical protein FJT64_007378 [Amphibalanus amphitrite]